MRINSYLTTLLAAGAAAFAVAAAPMAAAAPTGTTNTTGSTVHQAPGNAQITAAPGAAAQQAARLQNHSAGIPAPCYSTTSGAGAGPDGTENDCALRAGSSQSRLTAYTGKDIAKDLGVSPATPYRYLASERADREGTRGYNLSTACRVRRPR